MSGMQTAAKWDGALSTGSVLHWNEIFSWWKASLIN